MKDLYSATRRSQAHI